MFQAIKRLLGLVPGSKVASLRKAKERATRVFTGMVVELEAANVALDKEIELAVAKADEYRKVASQAASHYDDNKRLINRVKSLVE